MKIVLISVSLSFLFFHRLFIVIIVIVIIIHVFPVSIIVTTVIYNNSCLFMLALSFIAYLFERLSYRFFLISCGLVFFRFSVHELITDACCIVGFAGAAFTTEYVKVDVRLF